MQLTMFVIIDEAMPMVQRQSRRQMEATMCAWKARTRANKVELANTVMAQAHFQRSSSHKCLCWWAESSQRKMQARQHMQLAVMHWSRSLSGQVMADWQAIAAYHVDLRSRTAREYWAPLVASHLYLST